jgi:hypothetical protein
MTRLAVPFALALASLAASAEGLKYERPDLEMELGLTGAVFQLTPDANGPTLLLDLARFGDRWERAWGIARHFNVAIHGGRVLSASVSESKVQIRLVMKMEGDSWVEGGRADYEIELQRHTEGIVEGEFRGTFRGKPVSGRAFGQIKRPQKLIAGYIPVQPGEHPRILFRQHDIPRLREKAKTPLGLACLAAMGSMEGCGDAVGLGVTYHATGDPSWAEKARESTARHMADRSVPAFARGRQWGPRIQQVALAYDLCCDAWPPAFRKEVESYLRFICNQAYFDPLKLGQSINWNVTSNFAGPIYAGTGLTGLALWGEKGPEPSKPLPPPAVETLRPAEGYQPPKGVPVVPLVTGKGFKAWLATEGHPFGLSNDPMLSLGGLESLRPEPGASIQVDNQKATFNPLDPKHVLDEGGINLRSGLKKSTAFTFFAYTVVQVPEARTLKVQAPFSKSGRVQAVLNGVRVAHEQVIRVEKGLYPLLVALRLGADWQGLRVWFDEAGAADLERSKSHLAARQAEHLEQIKDWEYDRREWQRLGGTDPNFLRIYEMSRRMMVLFCREGCGTGGYQAESGHYFNDALEGPDVYASGFRTMFGRDLSTMGDISHYIPRLIFARVYTPDGRSHSQNISSSVSANGTRTANLFPVIPDALKPAVLWHWNRETGGNADRPDWSKLARENPAGTFVNYPMDLRPQPPAACMPLTWEAPDYGHFTFRNGWAGADDVVVQVFAKQKSSGGWGGPDAGTFRILGLGHAWAVGNVGREVRRWLENAVVLPENPDLTESELGEVTHIRTEKDGSGSVSIDLTGLLYEGKAKGLPWRERYGGVRHPGTAKPIGTALRAVAVDFSGRCGAPCLFALADRVEGGKSKEWYWQVPDVKAVTTQPNGFTIRQGNATLRAVFIAPAPVKLEVTREGRSTIKGAGHGGGTMKIQLDLSAVIAQGADPADGRFFVVATLQRGDPPAIAVAGKGLDARATVGKRVVRFDGTRVIVE